MDSKVIVNKQTVINNKKAYKPKFRDHFEKKDSAAKIIAIYVILTIALIINIYPILDILKISLRPYSSLFSTDLSIIPKNLTFKNYITILTERAFAKWMINSIIVATISAVAGVTVAVTAAYAYSRYKFKGKKMTLTAFLLTQIFPAPMLLLPTYIMFQKFNLIDSYVGIFITYIATSVPFSVWVLKGYFDTISASMEESAIIDGANTFQIITKIVIPLTLPAIGVTFLNAFMAAWNEYVIARIVLTDDLMKTLPVGLVGLTGSFRTDWGIYSAGAIMTAIPVMIVFMSLSKFLINGLTLGGVKE